MVRQYLLALTLIAAIFAPSFAQDPQPAAPPPPIPQSTKTTDQDDVVRINTNLVQVDAVVTKNGKPVKNLNAEDFEIFEDGHKQTITTFQYVSNVPGTLVPSSTGRATIKDTPPTPGKSAGSYETRRTMALVVDDLGTSAESMASIRKQLRKFVNERLQPNDLVAIIRTGGDVGALQQFTTDGRLLLYAIDQLRWNICSRVGPTVFSPYSAPILTGPNNPAMMNSSFAESLIGACGYQSVGSTLRSLNFILRSMGELPGRKSMVIFSDSLPREEQELPSTFIEYQLGRTSSMPGSRNFYFGLQKLAEIAIRNSIVIYGVDTQGLQYTGPTAADSFRGSAQDITNQINSLSTSRSALLWQRREGTELLAKETGGFLVRNSNSFKLDEILEEQEGYYLIGYRPTDETFNRKFHHLKVQAKGSGLQIRTRKGFYGVSEEEASKTRLTTTDKTMLALASPFAAHDITVDLAAFFAYSQATGSMLRSFLNVQAKDLTFIPEANGSAKTTFEVRGIIFGNNGAVVDQVAHTATLTLTSQGYDEARRDGLALQFDMPIKRPGGYQFRVAVRDLSTSHLGSAGQFVSVPDLKNKRLAMSGIVVLPTTAKVEASSNGQVITTSPASRRFTRGSDLMFATAVYNSLLDATSRSPRLTVQPRLFHEGKVVNSSQPLAVDLRNQTDFTNIVVRGVLHLNADLEPGKYFLQLIVVDGLAREKQNEAAQWIDFEVLKP